MRMRVSSSKNSSGTSCSMGAGGPSPIQTNTRPLTVRVGYALASVPAFPHTPEFGPSESTMTFLPDSSYTQPWYGHATVPW